MPPLPPVELMLDVGLYALLIPFAVATVVGLFCGRVLPQIGRNAGGLLAVSTGFLAANYFRQVVEFRLDPEHAWSLVEFCQRAGNALSGATQPGGPPARFWLTWSVLAVAIGGLIVQHRRPPGLVAWSIRVAVVLIATLLLVPAGLRSEAPWLWPALAVVLLANWQIVESTSINAPTPWQAAISATLFLASSAVLIHAHSARFSDIATIQAGCWLGIVLVESWQGKQLGGAIPFTTVGLPGLILIAQQSTYSDVPLAAFVVLGVAPLALVPLLRYPQALRPSWKYALLGWSLVSIPALVAVVLALRYETLSFE